MSHGSFIHVLGFTFALGLLFMTHDMIQGAVTWQ